MRCYHAWQIVQQIIWRREDLSHPLRARHEIEFWASNGLLVAALVGIGSFWPESAAWSFKPSSGLGYPVPVLRYWGTVVEMVGIQERPPISCGRV